MTKLVKRLLDDKHEHHRQQQQHRNNAVLIPVEPVQDDSMTILLIGDFDATVACPNFRNKN